MKGVWPLVLNCSENIKEQDPHSAHALHERLFLPSVFVLETNMEYPIN
jgi:hypothetical protein